NKPMPRIKESSGALQIPIEVTQPRQPIVGAHIVRRQLQQRLGIRACRCSVSGRFVLAGSLEQQLFAAWGVGRSHLLGETARPTLGIAQQIEVLNILEIPFALGEERAGGLHVAKSEAKELLVVLADKPML